MAALFSRGRTPAVIDDERIAWEFDAFEWLLAHYGGFELLAGRRLLTPTPEDFPVAGGSDHAWAKRLFNAMKTCCGMGDWQCTFEEIPRAPQLEDAFPLLPRRTSNKAHGTRFHRDEQGRAHILYDQPLRSDPERFIGMLSFDLGLWLLLEEPDEIPGGEDYGAHMAEIAAVFLGFGLFRVNAVFQYDKFSHLPGMHGWRVSRQGYLGEAELSFAVAIFMTLLEVPWNAAKPYLELNPRAYVQRSLLDIDERWLDRIEYLSTI